MIITTVSRIYVFDGEVDMRSGFERLVGLVRSSGHDIWDQSVFLFLGKNRHRLKLLTFDGTGLVVVVKRLEKGIFQSLSSVEKKELTVKELRHIFAGDKINFPLVKKVIHTNKVSGVETRV